MKQTVTTMDVRQRLGDLLNRVSLRHDEFIIQRRGRPLAALVPVEVLVQMRRAARLHLSDVLERQTAGLTESRADALADEAKHATRTSKR